MKVLVVVAHPDDETLGMGETISRHAAMGDTVHAVYMSDGVLSRLGATYKDVAERAGHADSAAAVLGFTWMGRGSWPNQAMDQVSVTDLGLNIRKWVVMDDYERVYTHHPCDRNADHHQTYLAVVNLFRPLVWEGEIWTFSVRGDLPQKRRWRGWATQYDEVGDKRRAWKCYQEEYHRHPEAANALTEQFYIVPKGTP